MVFYGSSIESGSFELGDTLYNCHFSSMHSEYTVDEQIGRTTATSSSGNANSESVFSALNEGEAFFIWMESTHERHPGIWNFIHMHLGKHLTDQYWCC